MLTKEECEEALRDIEFNLPRSYKYFEYGFFERCAYVNQIEILKNLIYEHFNNPPLKFEELQERETYYHIYYGWISIRSISDCECILINTLNSDGYKQIEFEENRFYRKEVQEWTNY